MKNLTARDSFPDILRGFALLGIALVNVPFLSIDTAFGVEEADLSQPSNAVAAFLVMAFFQAKFYLLFSFLFGYSAHYVIKGLKTNRRRWVARSIGLMLFGVLHFTFLFHGDILFVYGLLGLILLALYFRKDSVVKGWAIGLYIAQAVFFTGLAIINYVAEIIFADAGKSMPELDLTSPLNEPLASGTFLETIPARVELWALAAPNGFLLQGPLVFVAFLVGVLVARKNGLVSANESLLKKLMIWGLLVGLPLQLVSAYLFVANAAGEYSPAIYLIAISLNFLTAPLLSAAYVAMLWFLAKRLKLALLGAAGRLSLSVYLSQSLVFSILFSAWGFGLFRELGVAEVSVIAILTWLVLSLLALVYLRFQSKGPMESVLTGFSKLFERRS